MRTEEIERYLTRQMTDEEREAFEQEMQDQPQLREDVKIVAWTIEAIRERGRQEDAERIRRMREQMGSDSKRYSATAAAVIGGVLIVAAMTAVSIPPLYNKVIKPAIESVFGGESTKHVTPKQSSSAASIDSLANGAVADSTDVNPQMMEEDKAEAEADEPQQADKPKAEEKPEQQKEKENNDVKDEPTKPDMAEDKTESENKEEKETKEVKTTNKASNLDIRQMVENTEYHLTKIDYDNKGNLVAYLTLLNNKESLDFDLSQMPTVNIDGYVRTAYRVTADGATTQSFKLRKRLPVNLVIYFNGVKTGASKITLLQVRNANEYKSLQMKGISLN
jgi:hypothetical protein